MASLYTDVAPCEEKWLELYKSLDPMLFSKIMNNNNDFLKLQQNLVPIKPFEVDYKVSGISSKAIFFLMPKYTTYEWEEESGIKNLAVEKFKCIYCHQALMSWMRLHGINGSVVPKDIDVGIFNHIARKCASTQHTEWSLVPVTTKYAFKLGTCGGSFDHFSIDLEVNDTMNNRNASIMVLAWNTYFPLLDELLKKHRNDRGSLMILSENLSKVLHGNVFKNSVNWLLKHIHEDYIQKSPFDKAIIISNMLFDTGLLNDSSWKNPVCTLYRQTVNNIPELLTHANDVNALTVILKNNALPEYCQYKTSITLTHSIKLAKKKIGDIYLRHMTFEEANKMGIIKWSKSTSETLSSPTFNNDDVLSSMNVWGETTANHMNNTYDHASHVMSLANITTIEQLCALPSTAVIHILDNLTPVHLVMPSKNIMLTNSYIWSFNNSIKYINHGEVTHIISFGSGSNVKGVLFCFNTPNQTSLYTFLGTYPELLKQSYRDCTKAWELLGQHLELKCDSNSIVGFGMNVTYNRSKGYRGKGYKGNGHNRSKLIAPIKVQVNGVFHTITHM